MSDARLADWALRLVLEAVLDDLIACGQADEPTGWRTNAIYDLVEARDRPDVYLARQRALPGSPLALWQATRRPAGPKPEANALPNEGWRVDEAARTRLHRAVARYVAGDSLNFDDFVALAEPSHAFVQQKPLQPKRTDTMYDAMHDRAKRGYQAYGEFRGWKNYTGLPMPAWDALPPEIQEAWRAATAAIVAASDDVGAGCEAATSR